MQCWGSFSLSTPHLRRLKQTHSRLTGRRLVRRPDFSSSYGEMDLPTSREIDLETLLRERDAQVAELSVSYCHFTNRQGLSASDQDEVTRLRQYLSTQPGPSIADPVSLPPTLVSLLLPHIANNNNNNANSSGSTTVTTALTQRTRLLQEENDELYELLKYGETGKLKEEVRGLRRVIERLEGALRGRQIAVFRPL